MKILVANLGSTSFKYRLFDMADERQLARGGVERIGSPESRCFVEISGKRSELSAQMHDHAAAVQMCLKQLTDPQTGCLKDASEVAAIGFKAVHGGSFSGVQRVTPEVLSAMEKMSRVAPAHNPPYIAAMRLLNEKLPGIPLVAAFETGFHATIPSRLRVYAAPFDWAEKYNVRRWGFHGASHRYIATRIAELMDRNDLQEADSKPLSLPEGEGSKPLPLPEGEGWGEGTGREVRHPHPALSQGERVLKPLQGERVLKPLRVISCHLGGSSSLCAIRNGKSVANSLGMSPQSGIPHNNRVGDFDAFALPVVMQATGKSLDQVLDDLAERGGLLGLSGASGDVRDLEAAAAAGNERAKLALDVFISSVRHYLGAYLVELGGADAIVFTGGIGENGVNVRTAVCAGLEELGIVLDPAKNAAAKGESQIQSNNSRVQIWVMPTNEELVVARQAKELLG